MKHFSGHARLRLALLISILAGGALAQPALAGVSTPPSRAALAQLGDPYVPPHVRSAARAMLATPAARPSSGAQLQAQALAKLLREFKQADLEQRGRVSKAQARQSGFGFMVQHFEQIDTQRHGSVSFGELKTFMRANGASF
jgi:hypothetical protein